MCVTIYAYFINIAPAQHILDKKLQTHHFCGFTIYFGIATLFAVSNEDSSATRS